jgi:UPF0755 protein
LNIKKFIIAALLLIVAIAAFMAPKYIKSNTADFGEKKYFYVPTGSTYESLKASLKNEGLLKDISSFEKVASGMNLNKHVNAGRYEFTQGMSNYSIAKMFRSGNQKPVKLVLNKYRTKKDLISKIAKELEADSLSLSALMNDNSYLSTFDLDSNTSIAAFTPNTYEFYWNSDAKKIFNKISKAYQAFWTDDNKAKAKALNLTPAQVFTLASIVDEETNKKDEKGNVASVYLNRLQRGMKLQADPTAKFAYGDFSIKRVLNKHIEFPSPYNTYYTEGLPPGPICNPSKSSVEAVLNAPKTNYLFFCAKEDFSGHHNFASSDVEHMANAKKFQAAMDARNIKK